MVLTEETIVEMLNTRLPISSGGAPERTFVLNRRLEEVIGTRGEALGAAGRTTLELLAKDENGILGTLALPDVELLLRAGGALAETTEDADVVNRTPLPVRFMPDGRMRTTDVTTKEGKWDAELDTSTMGGLRRGTKGATATLKGITRHDMTGLRTKTTTRISRLTIKKMITNGVNGPEAVGATRTILKETQRSEKEETKGTKTEMRLADLQEGETPGKTMFE